MRRKRQRNATQSLPRTAARMHRSSCPRSTTLPLGICSPLPAFLADNDGTSTPTLHKEDQRVPKKHAASLLLDVN